MAQITDACMHARFFCSATQAYCISLHTSLLLPLSCVHTHTLKPSLSHTHTHPLLSSKGSVAYKLAAVSSQSLRVGRGKKDICFDWMEENSNKPHWIKSQRTGEFYWYFYQTEVGYSELLSTDLVQLNSCWAPLQWTVLSSSAGLGKEEK